MLQFFPISRKEMMQCGIEQLDIIIVTGDAYIDHPSFAAAMVGRYCEFLGCSVGILAMPDMANPQAFLELGPPKLFFGVTAGNVDSMMSLFTAQKKPRSDDPYVPGGMARNRPQRATIAYCNQIRRQFKNTPIVLGGIEASLRRISHYDYWSNTVRQSVLLDAKADMLVYGMAEHQLREIITRCKKGQNVKDMHDIPGTAVALGKTTLQGLEFGQSIITLPSHEQVGESKDAFLQMTRLFYENPHKGFLQHSGTRAVLVNKPPQPLTQQEFDALYDLPFTYKPHPSYAEKIPAFEQIKDSITIVRGCFGGCNFCGLGAHQGKTIQSRSLGSIQKEVGTRAKDVNWKGIVSDVGGPTANMYALGCKRPDMSQPCIKRSCLVPTVCRFLETNQSHFADVIHSVSAHKSVKHAYVNSGIRMDLALLYPDIISVIAQKATGGQLSIAPEHIVGHVLAAMNKPQETGWEQFESLFSREGKKAGKEQYLIPYFIAGHPGCTLKDALDLGQYLKKRNLRVRQVQEFIPIPMTVSCAMYYAGKDPFTLKNIVVSYKLSDVRAQKDAIMWWNNNSKRENIGHG